MSPDSHAWCWRDWEREGVILRCVASARGPWSGNVRCERYLHAAQDCDGPQAQAHALVEPGLVDVRQDKREPRGAVASRGATRLASLSSHESP